MSVAYKIYLLLTNFTCRKQNLFAPNEFLLTTNKLLLAPNKSAQYLKAYLISNVLFLAEAVNLELININSNNNNKKSSNGKSGDLPVKKDGDVEMGRTKDESYDEYFVPVNEHRKYMR